jgi:hypothetical protein
VPASAALRTRTGSQGSCWRKLTPGRQALLVLADLRKGETFVGLAAGFGIGTATAVRHRDRGAAAQVPKRTQAPWAAKKTEHA